MALGMVETIERLVRENINLISSATIAMRSRLYSNYVPKDIRRLEEVEKDSKGKVEKDSKEICCFRCCGCR